MDDAVRLEVDGRVFERFASYVVDADVFTADSAFTLELADHRFIPSPGAGVRMFVNDVPELVGIIDTVEISTDKTNGTRVRIAGRDIAGLAVDARCTVFGTFRLSLVDLAVKLFSEVPLLASVPVRTTRAAADAAATPRQVRIAPGQTVFEGLRSAALSAGLMFGATPAGEFVFSGLAVTGEPDYRIVFGAGGNALSASRTRSIERRHTPIIITARQGGSFDPDTAYVRAELPDPGMPITKPYVEDIGDDGTEPMLRARMIRSAIIKDSDRLVYDLPGHSQNGRNWTPNRLVAVIDPQASIDGTWLVAARQFRRSRTHGTTTRVTLSPMEDI